MTLIEIVLMIMIIGIMAGVTARILLVGLDVYALLMGRKDAYENARMAMDRMFDEMLIMNTYGSPPRLSITRARSDEICFVNKRGVRNFRLGTLQTLPVLYLREGCLWGDDHLLAQNAPFLEFAYYKVGGVTKRIGFELAVSGLGGTGTIWIRTAVFPRKLMYEDFE